MNIHDLPDADVALLACRPVNPDEYTGQRAEAWKQAVEALGLPPVVGESTKSSCEVCEIEVWLGPRIKQMKIEMEERNKGTFTACLMCAVMIAEQERIPLDSVVSLGGD